MGRGFTLIELVVTLGILVVLTGFALFFSMESYRSGSFYLDRNMLVVLLQHARAQSMNTLCMGQYCGDSKPHGVAILDGRYVLFQGPTYDTRDAEVDLIYDSNSSIAKNGLTEIVFSQLSGTSTPGEIELSDAAAHVSTIAIDANGRITWTH